MLLLSVAAFADSPVYCPLCEKHLYDYQKEFVKGETVLAKDFKPADTSISQPSETSPMTCPFDSAPLNLFEYVLWEKGMKAPVFNYPALSLLTKDEDGNFIYLPYDKPILEDWEGK